MFKTILFILLISGLLSFVTESIGMIILIISGVLLAFYHCSDCISYKNHRIYIMELLSEYQSIGTSYKNIYKHCQYKVPYFNENMLKKVLGNLVEEGVLEVKGNVYKLAA